MLLMINQNAYRQLQHYSSQNYNFQEVDQIPEVACPRIGEGIPREGDVLKYTNSFTPTQQAQGLSLTFFVVSILATATFVTLALIYNRSSFYWGVIPSGLLTMGGLGVTCHYFGKIDLDSPKTRACEIQKIREKQLTLAQLNRFYGGGQRIASYQLLGEAPANAYTQVALLCEKQRRVDEVYQATKQAIERVYNAALAPAKRQYDQAVSHARMAEVGGGVLLSSRRVVPAVAGAALLGVGAYAEGVATTQFTAICERVQPSYTRAIESLNRGYQNKVSQLHSALQAVSFV